jgi:hypothetical protein
MHRRVLGATKIDRAAARFSLSTGLAPKFPAYKNALCHRAFLQSRSSGGVCVRIARIVVVIVACKRASCAFDCDDDASRTRFLKWNAAFFVVL